MNSRVGALIAVVLLIVFALFRLMEPDSYEIRNAQSPGETIVCFGDSLTFGTGASPGLDYPSQLSILIGQPVINTGVPGDTTAEALRRIDEVLEHRPRMVLLTLGGNDLKNGVSRQAAFTNLEQIVNRLQEAGALVVIGGLQVRFRGRGFSGAYEELAERTGSLLVPDILDGIMENRNLMSDVIHPNSEGYAIMASHFYGVIQPYL